MKVTLISHVLPPSLSGQAMIIYKLLKDLNASNYFLISIENYTKNRKIREYSNKLSGKYYFLSGIFPRIVIINKGINKLKRVLNISPFLHLRTYLRMNQIIKILKKENPDAVIACTGDLIDLPSAYNASKKLNIPFYTYVFDYYSYQWTIPKERAFARANEEIILKGSTGVIVPNEFMYEELKRVYGIKSTIVYNCNDSITTYTNNNPWPIIKDKISVVYTGAIYNAHYGAFRNLVKAINSFKNENINLHVYTNQTKEWLIKQEISKKVVYHNNVPLSESLEIQKKADILFLPLAFNTKFPEVINTSMPGKMGEYLASGRPILVHAPKDSFVSWYFKKNNCGVVVDKEDLSELKKAIKKIVNDNNFREIIVQNALLCSKNDFDIEKAKQNFFDAINFKE
ncbi:MAG TPA: glycosyltransferase family 4 protein [Methanofastidiosum sp.]|nr:glycosyltransferase family 4 protein [Methanofastidiosum sp.]HQK63306.1 glycosyltransferase family 4 protein [Methanofastidiosum sp.]